MSIRQGYFRRWLKAYALIVVGIVAFLLVIGFFVLLAAISDALAVIVFILVVLGFFAAGIASEIRDDDYP